jgi:hypothetical protein
MKRDKGCVHARSACHHFESAQQIRTRLDPYRRALLSLSLYFALSRNTYLVVVKVCAYVDKFKRNKVCVRG